MHQHARLTVARSTRRDFLLAAGEAAGALALPAFSLSQAASPRSRILSAHLGEPVQCPNSGGDLWTATWADDGELYVASDDTTAFDGACSSNLAVNRLTGEAPPNLRGATVNCMKEYGGGSESRREDGGMWKACGLTCVDGVLYMSVSRHLTCPTEPNRTWEGYYSPFWIQETWDASIVKSDDHGRTWSRMPELGRAMFPGRAFSTPFFVQYGKDGEGTKDGADRYVYTVSNDGAWNNGNWMTLGRVRKDRIGRLDGSDWEFVHGFDERRQPIWRPRYDYALYIFRAPGRTSMTGIHYIQGLDLYILPQWHYPDLDDPARRFARTRLEFYQSPAPWGPWTRFHQQDFQPQSWYNPCIPGKFVSRDGKKFWLFVAGDFLGAGKPAHTYYALWMVPVELEIQSVKDTM